MSIYYQVLMTKETIFSKFQVASQFSSFPSDSLVLWRGNWESFLVEPLEYYK